MSQNDQLGRTPKETDGRDAIHVAIAPITAAQKLAPGQDVGLVGDDRAGICDDPIGIVDPFLKHLVFPDQRFWLLLYPNTITSLAHAWEHPAFDVPSLDNSKVWLEEFAKQCGIAGHELIDHIKEYVATGDPWVQMDSERARTAFEDCIEKDFWTHVKNVTGLDKPKDEEVSWGSPFSCSC